MAASRYLSQVCASGAVLLLILATCGLANGDSVVATIPVGDAPSGIAFSPSGQYAYVTHFGHVSTYKVAVETNESTVLSAGTGGWSIAVDTTGSRAYIGDGYGNVRILNLANGGDMGALTFAGAGNGVAVSSSTGAVYATSASQNNILKATRSGASYATTSISIGGRSSAIAVDPTGSYALVGSSSYTPPGTIWKIDLTTEAVTAVFTGFTAPTGIAFDPRGRYAYVASDWTPGIVRIDLSSNSVSTFADGLIYGPWGIAVTPDGEYAYVVDNSSDTVVKVNLATNHVSEVLPVGHNPREIAINPAGTFALVSNQDQDTVSKVAIDPEVRSVAPTSGPSAGGTRVTITGSRMSSSTSVTVGTTPCTDVSSNAGGTQITCVTGAHAAGVANVSVTNPGTSTSTLNGSFLYLSTQDPNASSYPSASAGTSIQGTALSNLNGPNIVWHTSGPRNRTATAAFTAAPSTNYGIGAVSGKKSTAGTCAIRNRRVTCSIHLPRAGKWTVFVTPMRNGAAEPPSSKVIRAR